MYENPQDVKPLDGPDTILKSDLLEMAAQEALRMRAFGETVIYGHHKPFTPENRAAAVEVLSQMIDDGLIGVYQDEEGLFVGPINPALIEPQEVSHGL